MPLGFLNQNLRAPNFKLYYCGFMDLIFLIKTLKKLYYFKLRHNS
jgi:hypothetical protein